MTKWKVLPREQCQGGHVQVIWRNLPNEHRNTEFRRQFHHPKLELRGKPQIPANIPQQAEPGSCSNIETGMATQLAYLHQRDNFLVPHKSIHL